MSDVTVTLGADSAEFKQALTEIQKSMDVLVNSTTAKTARLGLAFTGVKDMVSTAFAAIDGAVQKAFDFVAPSAAIQRVEKELTGLTGSAAEAHRILENINEWALTSQYTPTEMFKNAAQLIRGGISESFAPDLVRQLATIAQGDQSKMNALVAAMVKAGSSDPAKYLPELAKTEGYKGVTGTISFDEKGDVKNGALTLYTYKDGKREQVAVVR